VYFEDGNEFEITTSADLAENYYIGRIVTFTDSETNSVRKSKCIGFERHDVTWQMCPECFRVTKPIENDTYRVEHVLVAHHEQPCSFKLKGENNETRSSLK